MKIEDMYNLPVQNLASAFFDDEEWDQVPDWLRDRMNMIIDSILSAVSKDSLKIVQASKIQTIASLSGYLNELFNYYDKQLDEYKSGHSEKLIEIIASMTIIRDILEHLAEEIVKTSDEMNRE